MTDISTESKFLLRGLMTKLRHQNDISLPETSCGIRSICGEYVCPTTDSHTENLNFYIEFVHTGILWYLRMTSVFPQTSCWKRLLPESLSKMSRQVCRQNLSNRGIETEGLPNFSSWKPGQIIMCICLSSSLKAETDEGFQIFFMIYYYGNQKAK